MKKVKIIFEFELEQVEFDKPEFQELLTKSEEFSKELKNDRDIKFNSVKITNEVVN